MTYYELLFSPTGGTKKVSHHLMSTLTPRFTSIDLMQRDTDYAALPFTREDVCLAAVPSFGGRVPTIAAQRLAALQGNGARVILVAVYGNRHYDDTLVELEDLLRQAGFRPVAAVAAVAEHSVDRAFGQGRPDAADKAELDSFGELLRQHLDNGYVPEALNLPGSRPYKPLGALPIQPLATEDCGGCGLCAKVCPVGAIDPEDPKQAPTEACITCMACVAACSTQSRQVPAPVMAKVSGMLAQVCGGRKENRIF